MGNCLSFFFLRLIFLETNSHLLAHCREWGVREGDEGSSFTESYWANGFSVRIFQREGWTFCFPVSPLQNPQFFFFYFPENQPWMFIFGFIQLLITLVAAKYIWFAPQKIPQLFFSLTFFLFRPN